MDSFSSGNTKPKLQTQTITRTKSASSQNLSRKSKFNDELAAFANKSSNNNNNIRLISNSNKNNQRLRATQSSSTPSLNLEPLKEHQEQHDGDDERYRRPISTRQYYNIQRECSHSKKPRARDDRLIAAASAAAANDATWATGSDCAYATGDNLRCRCAGTRRTTLAGLIELFEQKVRVGEQAPQLSKLSIKRRISSPSLPLQRVDYASGEKVSKQTTTAMRDIITPVKYERSSPESTASFDSLSEQSADDDEKADNERQQQEQRAVLHRTSIKGVPVLPSKSVSEQHPDLLRKLTRTRWQPPTDGRKYELLLANRSQTPTAASSVNYCQKAASPASRCPSIVKHQASSSRRLLSQLARLRRLSEPNYKIKRPERVAQVESLIDQLERATIEWEEDEHLLERAERRDWPARYHERFSSSDETRKGEEEEGEDDEDDQRVGRGSTFEQVGNGPRAADFGRRVDVEPLEENSIARSHWQLMEAAAGSQSASSTLRRAKTRARRPSAFADRYYDDLAVRRLSRSLLTTSPDSGSQSNFNAPQMSYLLCSNAYTPSIEGGVEPYLASLERRVQRDDLHFRNVRHKLDPHEPPFGIPRQQTGHSSASHYLRRELQQRHWDQDEGQATATVGIPSSSLQATTTANCVCNCACQQAPASAPVGGRNDSAPSSGRRTDSRVSFASQNRFETNSLFANKQGDEDKLGDRPDGCASADSGLAIGANTPSSPTMIGGRQSASSRLSRATTAATTDSLPTISPQTPDNGADFNQNTQDHIELERGQEEEQDEEEQREWNELMRTQLLIAGPEDARAGSCESPAPERHLAQFCATPVRRRPKISIENPRAKSPLLRTTSVKPVEKKVVISSEDIGQSSIPVKIQCYEDSLKRSKRNDATIGELECHYDFEDDEENDQDEESEGGGGRVIVTTTTTSTRTTKTDTIKTKSCIGTSESSSLNESSIERLNYRDTIKSGNNDTRQQEAIEQTKAKNGPKFSIGEYQPSDKQRLKIL